MTSDSEQRLHEMIEQVEETREKLAQYKGQRTQVLKQLAELGIKTPDQAQKVLKKLEKECGEKSEALSRLISRLESNFNWK